MSFFGVSAILLLFFHKMYDWLLEKHQAASEEITDLSNIRGKYQRHQAFEAELAASKDKLDQIKEVHECTSLLRCYM